jgi:hypothetical protein
MTSYLERIILNPKLTGLQGELLQNGISDVFQHLVLSFCFVSESSTPAQRVPTRSTDPDAASPWLPKDLTALLERPTRLLAEAVAIHNRLRYDPTPAEPLLLERLQLLCRNLKTLLR